MASLLILAGTFWSVFNYPIGALILLIAVLVYGAVVFFYPVAWLVVLPLMLPLIDLAPWTGRFFLDEFDIFVAMTLAVSWWKDRHLPYAAGFTLTGKWLLGLFAASTVISVCLGAAPLPAIDANAFSSYLSHYNALRVAKGFFWALLLVFPLNRRIEENPSLAWFLLATGILVGLAGVGVVALWERQIFGELFNGASLYSIAGRMMEFGTSYRITGMFSGMHTGGEAIDGYLVLALPVACFVAVFAHRFSTRIVASISLALGTYALVSTFTRATYGAFAGSVLIFSVLAAVRYRELLISNWRPWALGLTGTFFSSGRGCGMRKDAYTGGVSRHHRSWLDSVEGAVRTRRTALSRSAGQLSSAAAQARPGPRRCRQGQAVDTFMIVSRASCARAA